MSSLPARDFTNPRAKHGFQGRTCSVTGVGAYVPERVVTNADLEKVVETTDEWITSRTGIRARRIAADNEFCSDLAAKAAERAELKRAQAAIEALDPERVLLLPDGVEDLWSQDYLDLITLA
mgnify:CR=1 FL=1